MPGRISCPTLVGREGELHRLQAYLDDDAPALLLVHGEAGIGKSRLLEHALAAARSSGAAVLTGSCVPFAGRSLPYGPITDALRPRDATTATPALTALRRELRGLLAAATPTNGAPGSDAGGQPQILETVLDGLERAAREGPIVLAIEDLHWSDAATRDLLGFLIPSRWTGRVRIVATLRTDEEQAAVRPMLIELDRARLLDRLELAPLGEDSVAEMVAGILGQQPTPPLLEAVRRSSGGNPFFVEEMVAAARGGDARLPPNLREILLARLASLPAPVQRVLRHMAVLGDHVPEPLLAAVTEADPVVLARRLRAAIRANVLRVDPGSGTCAFRHALMREALYADLLAGERRAMHQHVARTLASDAAERLLSPTARSLALAVHWDEAGDVARAVPALIAAAEAATTAHSYADALDLYRRCLARMEENPASSAVVSMPIDELNERAGLAAFLAGDAGAAVELARRAIDLAGTDDPERAGVLHQQLCEYLWQDGEEVESLEVIRRAYDLVPADGSPAARATVVGSWAAALNVMSRYAEAVEVAEEGIRIGRALADPAVTSICLAVRGNGRANLDDVDLGLRDATEALELARASGDPNAQAMAYLDGSWTIGLIGGDAERALVLVDEWHDLQRRNGLERHRGMWMAGVEGEMLMRLGRWREADEVLTAALRLPAVGPVRHEVALNAARLRIWQGRWDEAALLVAEVLSIAERTVCAQFIGPTYAVAIELATWRGDPVEALRLLDEAEARLIPPEDPLFTRQLYAAAVRACADRREQLRGRRAAPGAVELVVRAEALARRARYQGVPNLTARLEETLAWSAQAAAELARAESDSNSAESWRAVGDRWHRVGFAAHESYARLRETEAWLSRGRRDEATAAFEAGRELASSVGAGAALAALGMVADRARLRVRTVVEDPRASARPFGLTVRELEVLRLLVQGMTNRQIATELFISEKTAGVHVSNILSKLDVNSRGQAAAIAIQHPYVTAIP